MNKCKVTKKWLNSNFDCISVSYCGLQTLLKYESPMYYTCGVYGWNCDAYVVNVDSHEICITTGYRGMIDNFCSNNSYQLYNKYEKLAIEAEFDSSIDYGAKKKLVSDLLKQYIREVVAN